MTAILNQAPPVIAFDCKQKQATFTLDAAFRSDAAITGLFGASGSGKSTVLRLIAGLAKPERGHIETGGRTLLDTARRINVSTHRRNIGLVFQDAHLFPHLSVRSNLTYGRLFHRTAAHAPDLGAVTRTLGIDHLLDRKPGSLSGGERQRVAIGRALLAGPRILLMDEPLAALDTARKREILPLIESMRDTFAIPIVYVSHSVEEIARLAGTVVRLDQGKVTAIGPPGEVLSLAASASTDDRFEAVSIITGTAGAYDPAFAVTKINHPAGSIVVPGEVAAAANAPVRVTVRATNVSLSLERPQGVSIRTALKANVREIATQGPFATVTLALEGGNETIAASLTRLAVHDLGLTPGKQVYALIKTVAIDERGVTGAPLTK